MKVGADFLPSSNKSESSSGLRPLLPQFPTTSMAAPVAVAAQVGTNSILGGGVYSAASDYNLSSSSSLPAGRTYYGLSTRVGGQYHEMSTFRRCRPMSPSLQCLSRSRTDLAERAEESTTNTNLFPDIQMTAPSLRQ